MRRIWATMLAAMFSFMLIGPAMSGSSAEQKLPPCCRGNGKHHCGAPQSQERSSDPAVRAARCALFGGNQTIPRRLTAGVTQFAQRIAGAVLSYPELQPQAEALCRLSFDRSGQKRGPPFLI